MSPGINDRPRYTGTVPKSNRRNDRNRERSNSNQVMIGPTDPRDVSHQPNNLLEWHLVTDPHRSEKNSNTRPTSSTPSISYQDLADFDCSSQQRNHIGEDRSQWHRMAPPDSHTQSPPPQLQANKPTNVDKMPDRGQVESRLNQIKDYIRVTSTMMDSLSQSSDPRAVMQHDKLSKMVEDLYDSEKKLTNLLETYQNRGIPDESGDHPVQQSDQMRRFSDLMDVLTLQERCILTNPNCMNGEIDEHGDGGREAQLQRKVEETQRKLAQLQEQEASLLGMHLRAKERLNAARQAQQVFLQQGEQGNSAWEGPDRRLHQGQSNADELESEHAALRGKLVQLQNKKKRMDHLVAELQTVDTFDRGSCSSEGSRAPGRDKVAELDAMKAQLARLKALMEDATRDRHPSESEVEPEADEEVRVEVSANSSRNSIDRQSEPDDLSRRKAGNFGDAPSVDQVQAVTRELKEQSVLLQAARAELQRLKQTTPTPVITSSTPPPSLLGLNLSEKKQSNNNTNSSSNDERCEMQFAQAKRRQLEDLMRKEQVHSSSVNQDVGRGDWGGVRETNSQLSHTSVAANLWPLPNPATGESNEQSVDGASISENLLDVGPNGNATAANGNWWGVPPPIGMVEQPPQAGVVGMAEYYRQLLLGSQAQQLQMMGMTMQQCCQLLWAQQRELQSMRAAIIQLQLQLRQPQQLQQQQQHQQLQGRANNNYSNVGNAEEYSNLNRVVQHNGSSLDATLPPSSSLPNLVALPTPTPTPVPVPIPNPPHQQQQLNNQVPPGNRANNYWDNFRSYSRQNLLSVNGKTASDRNPHTTASTPTTNTVSSASGTASGGGNNTGLTNIGFRSRKDKRNREHGLENLTLPTLLSAEMQYPQNLQLQSNFQQQEVVNSRSSLNNVLANDMTLQQSHHVDNFFDEQQLACTRSVSANNDGQVCLRQLSNEMSDAVSSLVTVNTSRPGYLVRVLREVKIICEDHRLRPRLLRSLRALRDSHSSNNPLVDWLQNETTDQTASESCQSSDEDSDTGTLNNTVGNAVNQAVGALSLPPPPLPPPPLSMTLPLLPGGFQPEGVGINASASVTPGYNEDLAEADQSRPETSHNPQVASEENVGEEGGGDASTASANALIADLVAEMEYMEEDGERSDDIGLDRVPTRLYHQANESI
ncbi:uncharacterized protein LOC107220202 isoform X3 [Neodiprion lecontei]|uniref:Uncharacterized protein LOC107220202 isoform X3 n=1 Tax=Neodiprion lecontei TaxID=441921 RepID=A0A6J0BIW9_NEOLC|nr:uncharacterized protein LOC107220202 isoform X3 [Neodiprion lecontei]